MLMPVSASNMISIISNHVAIDAYKIQRFIFFSLNGKKAFDHDVADNWLLRAGGLGGTREAYTIARDVMTSDSRYSRNNPEQTELGT